MENNVTTKLKNLNLVDKFLFDETMEDREAYQAVISILLENETALLTKPQTEKELRVSPQLRQIRLDVVSMDEEKKLYYTEMQKKNTGNLIKRSRYYQSQLDVPLLYFDDFYPSLPHLPHPIRHSTNGIRQNPLALSPHRCYFTRYCSASSSVSGLPNAFTASIILRHS